MYIFLIKNCYSLSLVSRDNKAEVGFSSGNHKRETLLLILCGIPGSGCAFTKRRLMPVAFITQRCDSTCSNRTPQVLATSASYACPEVESKWNCLIECVRVVDQ